MAGGRRLELSLATAGSPGAGEEKAAAVEAQRAHRRTVSVLYAELAALLPDLPSRAIRADIVEAAVAHVKVLEDTAAVLEAYRAVRAGRGDGAAEVSSREAVCFAARLPAARRPGALRRVLEAFNRRGVEVLAATMARGGEGEGEAAAVVTVTAAAAAPEVVGRIKADIASIIE